MTNKNIVSAVYFLAGSVLLAGAALAPPHRAIIPDIMAVVAFAMAILAVGRRNKT